MRDESWKQTSRMFFAVKSLSPKGKMRTAEEIGQIISQKLAIGKKKIEAELGVKIRRSDLWPAP